MICQSVGCCCREARSMRQEPPAAVRRLPSLGRKSTKRSMLSAALRRATNARGLTIATTDQAASTRQFVHHDVLLLCLRRPKRPHSEAIVHGENAPATEWLRTRDCHSQLRKATAVARPVVSSPQAAECFPLSVVPKLPRGLWFNGAFAPQLRQSDVDGTKTWSRCLR